MSDYNPLSGLSIVIPVYKENAKDVYTLYTELVYLGAEVIVVDDGDTVNLPLDVREISYTPNQGYGYALKKGITASSNNLVLTMDGDNQHTVRDAINLYTAFKLISNCDMLIGQRHGLKEKFLRRFGRITLNGIGGLISGHHLTDLNSGMRIFKRDLAMNYQDILCDTFSFTTSLTLSMMSDDCKVFWFPIDVKPRKHGASHVKIIKDGLITLFYIIWVGLGVRTRGIRRWLRKYIPLVSRLMSKVIGVVGRIILKGFKKDSQ